MIIRFIEIVFSVCISSRMLLCFTASPWGSSCRQLAKSCPMPSTNMMPPAESSLDSPKRSLLQEKVGCMARFQLSSASKSFYLFVDYHLSPECAPKILVCDHVFSNLVVFLLPTALATLKPQAGLVAPQAVPASQPAAAVSDWLLIPVYQILISNTTLSFFSIVPSHNLCFYSLYCRVLVENLWRLVNRWEWPQRSSRR